MDPQIEEIIRKAYYYFNERDIDSIIHLLQKDVEWPNGWEGGYVHGQTEVREYWTRQWKEINPRVEPISINPGEDGRIEVDVRQTVRDLEGGILQDGKVKHVYTFKDGLISRMEIQ